MSTPPGRDLGPQAPPVVLMTSLPSPQTAWTKPSTCGRLRLEVGAVLQLGPRAWWPEAWWREGRAEVAVLGTR